MRKKNLALSALILSQALTQVTSEALASVRDDTNDLKLTSQVNVLGQTFNLRVNVHRDEATVNPGDAFEFQASASLGQNPQPYSFFAGDEHGDGNLIFQLKNSSEGKKTYAGIYCSSSFNDCVEFENGQKFELIYDINNKSWSASITTIFMSAEESENSEIAVDIHDFPLNKE